MGEFPRILSIWEMRTRGEIVKFWT